MKLKNLNKNVLIPIFNFQVIYVYDRRVTKNDPNSESVLNNYCSIMALHENP